MRVPQMRNHQKGLTTVEFAIVGAVLFMVLFGVLEFGRALYVANVMVEGTRRGARVAAVCRPGSGFIAQTAIFANAAGESRFVPGLTTAQHVVVSYLNQAGAPVANPLANMASISYVRVQIVGYQQTMMIPFVMSTLLMPEFAATLPAESLGFSPSNQAFDAC